MRPAYAGSLILAVVPDDGKGLAAVLADVHPGAYKNFQESAQLRIGESRTVGAERFEVGEDLVHTHAQPTLRFAAATERLEELREQWSGGVVVALQASRTASSVTSTIAAGRRRRQADGECPVPSS
jgi:hypothetical protein